MAECLVSCILSHFPKVAENLHSQFLTRSIALFFFDRKRSGKPGYHMECYRHYCNTSKIKRAEDRQRKAEEREKKEQGNTKFLIVLNVNVHHFHKLLKDIQITNWQQTNENLQQPNGRLHLISIVQSSSAYCYAFSR